MAESKSTVLVTGVAGNLGLRLLGQLQDFRVVGLDLVQPAVSTLEAFERTDLGQESSCDQLVRLLRETQASAVVHLAFVIDPVRTGILDVGRMWQINVAGTARVMEAIAEVNRIGGNVRKLIVPSSVSAYGPNLPGQVSESFPLGGHTLPYAIHKSESDQVVQMRAPHLGECVTFLLRPHIFAGASMQNYLIGALRGTPTGAGGRGARLRERGTRLPLLLPSGARYLKNRLQFVHVDDVARLIAYILRDQRQHPSPTILNVAGRGDAVSYEECAGIAQAKTLRLPGKWLCRAVLSLLWKLGISGVPPQALTYMTGSYLMSTARLQQFLGKDYESVIRYTVRDALADSFVQAQAVAPNPAHAVSHSAATK
jgi:nucleoside-diphosphate-sugar epimerase